MLLMIMRVQRVPLSSLIFLNQVCLPGLHSALAFLQYRNRVNPPLAQFLHSTFIMSKLMMFYYSHKCFFFKLLHLLKIKTLVFEYMSLLKIHWFNCLSSITESPPLFPFCQTLNRKCPQEPQNPFSLWITTVIVSSSIIFWPICQKLALVGSFYSLTLF